MVALDGGQVVRVVDHEASRLTQALLADISHPVEALEPRAISQVEAGNRVERFA